MDLVSGEGGQVEYRLSTHGDLRPEIARAVMEAGLDLLRLDRVLALEPLFLQLTGMSRTPAIPFLETAQAQP